MYNHCISATGELSVTSSTFAVTTPIELNPGDILRFYSSTISSSFSVFSETDSDFSFFKPLLLGNGINGTMYEYVADHHLLVCICLKTDQSTLKMSVEHEKVYEIIPELEWETGTAILKDGIRKFSFINPSYGISNVIRVYKGDRLVFHGYANTALSSISSSLPIMNTYTGSRNFIPLYVPQSHGFMDMEYLVQKNGYIILCSKVLNNPSGFENKLTIYRTEQNYQLSLIDKDPEYWINYADSLDFVPIVDSYENSGIFTYSADTKASSDHISNAVVYPNKEIIACRENGAVVKISNDGTETLLLNIPGTHDWRGVYMDKNLNVYVSPHSATFKTNVKQSDRALYRLAYGTNTFEKIIPLFYSPQECGVTINVYSKVSSFTVNSLYYYKDTLYKCLESHTKGSSFDESKFVVVKDVWQSNTSYLKGDVRMSNGNYWVCKTAHTSGISFDQTKWYPMTACMVNDDTIWTMCEDDKGHLYAGVYAHSFRRNPAVYKSTDGGETWIYQYNFVTGCMPVPSSGTHVDGGARHVHCINFNEYNNTLYACVGEVNTLCMSEDYGETWVDLNMPFYYGQPTMVIGARDGTLIGSDGHYSCGVSKISMDNKNVKPCGRTCPGFIFAMRRSDVTGWIYAFTRCDNVTGDLSKCPPMEAINDSAVLQVWKEKDANAEWLAIWERYHEWASKYYPDDAVRPIHAVIMVSKDEGETWEAIKYETANSNFASICGFITTGYFRNGECLTGFIKSIDGTENDKEFVCPIVVSEGVKSGSGDIYDLSGEIFIKTNSDTNVTLEDLRIKGVEIANGKLFLNKPADRSDIRVYSLKGELLFLKTITPDTSVIDLTQFGERILIIQVADKRLKVRL